MTKNEMKLTDILALERSKLANERTFLAYFRTSIVLLSSGFAILKIEILQDLKLLGYFFMIVALILLLIGMIRFLYVKKRMNKYYNN